MPSTYALAPLAMSYLPPKSKRGTECPANSQLTRSQERSTGAPGE